ncbi:MAG: SMC-Scp complex subunit ScpB [Kofleriaceae bacterium]
MASDVPADDEVGEPDGAAALPTSAAALEPAQLKQLVEALVFASDKPMTILRLRQLTRVSDTKRLEQALVELAEDYRDRGLVLQQVSGGYQFRTRTQWSAWVQQLIAGRPVRLTRAQLETLAIIAYRQPITRPEIDDIRGVDSSATLKLLIDRALIRILGKKEEVGRPMLYGTTKEFLDFFSLGDLRELPTLREYSELTDESRRVIHDRLGSEDEESETGHVASAADMPAADVSTGEPEVVGLSDVFSDASDWNAVSAKPHVAHSDESDVGVAMHASEPESEGVAVMHASAEPHAFDSPELHSSDNLHGGGDDSEDATALHASADVVVEAHAPDSADVSEDLLATSDVGSLHATEDVPAETQPADSVDVPVELHATDVHATADVPDSELHAIADVPAESHLPDSELHATADVPEEHSPLATDLHATADVPAETHPADSADVPAELHASDSTPEAAPRSLAGFAEAYVSSKLTDEAELAHESIPDVGSASEWSAISDAVVASDAANANANESASPAIDPFAVTMADATAAEIIAQSEHPASNEHLAAIQPPDADPSDSNHGTTDADAADPDTATEARDPVDGAPEPE